MSPTVNLVVPVKFSGGGLSLQTTTSRIGARGVFVRSALRPREGSQLTLSISLPGSARPLDATGTVAAPDEDAPKEAGFWARFDELSEDAQASLYAFLRTRGLEARRENQSRRAGDRRAYPRVAARLNVGWKSPKEFLDAYSENISHGGIFIVTDNPPRLREIVELSLALPDGLPPANTRAEVVHLVPVQSSPRGAVAGVGLQFLDATYEFRARLDACVKALEK